MSQLRIKIIAISILSLSSALLLSGQEAIKMNLSHYKLSEPPFVIAETRFPGKAIGFPNPPTLFAISVKMLSHKKVLGPEDVISYEVSIKNVSNAPIDVPIEPDFNKLGFDQNESISYRIMDIDMELNRDKASLVLGNAIRLYGMATRPSTLVHLMSGQWITLEGRTRAYIRNSSDNARTHIFNQPSLLQAEIIMSKAELTRNNGELQQHLFFEDAPQIQSGKNPEITFRIAKSSD